MPKRSAWSEYTKELLSVAGMSQHDMARRIAKISGVECSQGKIAGRLNSTETRVPPDLELEVWAQALDLHGEWRKKFFRLAQTERIPKRYRAEYTELFEKYEKQQEIISKMEAMNRELCARADKLEAMLATLTQESAQSLVRGEKARE
jgi:hypothetical protein